MQLTYWKLYEFSLYTNPSPSICVYLSLKRRQYQAEEIYIHARELHDGELLYPTLFNIPSKVNFFLDSFHRCKCTSDKRLKRRALHWNITRRSRWAFLDKFAETNNFANRVCMRATRYFDGFCARPLSRGRTHKGGTRNQIRALLIHIHADACKIGGQKAGKNAFTSAACPSLFRHFSFAILSVQLSPSRPFTGFTPLYVFLRTLHTHVCASAYATDQCRRRRRNKGGKFFSIFSDNYRFHLQREICLPYTIN